MHFSPPPGLVRRTLRKHRRQLLLCAVVVAMALLTLILVSKGAALQRRLFSPTQSSAWARSATAAPRAVFIVAQTSYSPVWCRMMLSAILSNVSVVSIGLGGKYKHSVRPAWLLDYMDDAGLRDEDVVVMFDGGDTFFTGPLGVKRAVEGFLATTAPSADAFNATAVHQGEATAPLLFESDPACWAPQIDLVVPLGPEDHFSRCFWYYERVWKAANSSPGQRLVRPPPWEYRHLAAGGMVGRVWAFREASKAYANLLARSDKWWCDQSLWALLFVWSVTRDPIVDAGLRIRYGLLSLNYNNLFFSLRVPGLLGPRRCFTFPVGRACGGEHCPSC
ncbi:hypothetical protein TRSC58_06536 [Trypanosoma rangeli SC58]|uniref:Expression site-associated gene (ESAG-like) protein n=1 Tax=Trypanosoma rangeli SC58 TaxID=429131 RepID=A0A061IXP3_TRYRA|nr:hypothetical protein TRSC58_06536 [Trypanosoma rangeli SC58]